VEQLLWFCIRNNYYLDELAPTGREERSYESAKPWSRCSLLI
jgi:hypothetical protein